ncbi:MAG: hypothetical protein AAF740_01610 [Bacteroidota bacterium]
MPKALNISPLDSLQAETPKGKTANGTVWIADALISPKQAEVAKHIEQLKKAGDSVYYETYGAWSNYHLTMELVQRCGKDCRVWIKSYNFTRKSAELFAHLKEQGFIRYLHATLDNRIVNAEHNAYGVIQTIADKVRLSSNHAKLILVEGESLSYQVITSANFTENPRNENGIIIREPNNLAAIIKAVEHEPE